MKLLDNILVRVRKLEIAVFGNQQDYRSYVEIAKATATNGTFTRANFDTLMADASCGIMRGHELYTLYEDHTESGYKVYAHRCVEGFKLITVTLSTRAWVLTEGE